MRRIVPNEERQAAVAKLTELFAQQPDGQRLAWLEIEQRSGVPMTGSRAKAGREWARLALRKAKRPYRPIGEGLGIELSAPANATEIAGYRTRRIVGEAKAAHRSVTNTLGRHADALEPQDREMLRANRSVTGALVEMSRGASRAALDRAPKLPQLPELPRAKAR